MKLAVSNIAWDQGDEAALLPVFRALGVTGIEVAPTKLWPEWVGAGGRAAEAYAARLRGEGFCVPSLQALVFGRSDLAVFQPETHAAFFEHMARVADLGAALGASVLVFGAPKNRVRGAMEPDAARAMAVGFFRRMAALCAARGVCLGLEANPAVYQCDFITNVGEARALVEAVGHAGFRLHLDAGEMSMEGGDLAALIAGAGSFVHFHASEPYLAPLAGGVVAHEAAGAALRQSGYEGWVAVEMRVPETREMLGDSVRRAAAAYLA